MTQYGFRLFVVSLHDGMTKKEQIFDSALARKDPHTQVTPTPVDYLDATVAYVTANTDKTSNMGVPKAVDPGDDENEVTTSRGSSTRLVQARREADSTRLWFTAGPINADGISADPTGQTKDISLAGRSTLHEYRATLVTITGGNRGILAVETRGRSCPYLPLRMALKEWSPVPWTLRVHENVADAAAVKEFIRRGEVEHVDLTEWTFDADGGRIAKQHVLSTRADQKSKVKAAKDALLRWVHTGKQTSLNKIKAEATELKGAFYAVTVDIPFNDVAVTVKHGTQRRTLRPSSDYRRFTYHLDDKPVSDDSFFNQAEMAAKELIKNVQTVTTGG